MPSHPELSVPVSQRGFNLVEMAIVVVIVGVFLGGLMVPLTAQFELRQRDETDQTIEEIHEALVGFAARTGRLPCPATATSNGLAAPNAATTACTTWHGFVPARTLGLNLNLDGDSLPSDPWLGPYRYSVSSADGGEYTNSLALGMAPDFLLCADAGCTTTMADSLVAMVFSLGEDGTATTSPDQLENIDGDPVFVRRTYSEAAGSEFDDRIMGISPNVLVFHLVRAGQFN